MYDVMNCVYIMKTSLKLASLLEGCMTGPKLMLNCDKFIANSQHYPHCNNYVSMPGGMQF